MRAKEFISEKVVGHMNIDNLRVEVDDHSFFRTAGRGASPKLVDYVLKLLPLVRDQIDRIELGQQFWVYSPEVSTALGFRKQMNSLLFKTVVPDKPYDGENPVLIVSK